MAAEQWEEEEDESREELEYASQLKESVVTLWEKVKINLEKAQERQKEVYDRGTKPRELEVGDIVLLLLPSSENKLLARWQGPYRVLDKVTPVTYKWQYHIGGGRNRSFKLIC